MEEQIDKYTLIFRYVEVDKTHCKRTSAGMHHKHNKSHTTKKIFLYQIINGTFDMKIRNVINSIQIQLTSHSRILKYH